MLEIPYLVKGTLISLKDRPPVVDKKSGKSVIKKMAKIQVENDEEIEVDVTGKDVSKFVKFKAVSLDVLVGLYNFGGTKGYVVKLKN